MSDIGTIYIEDLEVGLSREITKVIGDSEIHAFAELSEDRNPVHLDEAAAAQSVFKERVAHGMLSASLFSAVIGERLPGHGTIYLSQNLKFTAPVRPGDKVTARVSVREINLDKSRVGLDCIALVDDKPVIKGDATVLAPKRG